MAVPITELLLEAALPELSSDTRNLLMLLVRTVRVNPGCAQLAKLLGVSNRYALGRLLRRRGLPPYRELLGWLQVLTWVVEWEERRTSLSVQAFDAERYPGSLYRTVRRVTGAEWSQVQARGSLWVLVQLVNHCRSHVPLEQRKEAGAARPA
jgi:hypothetical protein